jgi:putative aldouronate transport system permease protein
MTAGRFMFNLANTLFMLFVLVITLYPILFVLASSLSDQMSIRQGLVGILPKGLNIEAYRKVLAYPMISRAYLNTVTYTVCGTAISLVLTVLGAYPLSRKRFQGRKAFSMIVVFAMLFNGGIIPTFLVVRNMGMYNTIWAILIPGAVWSFYIMIMKTFFQQIPAEIEEAANIDGCNPFQTLVRIIVPLSVTSLVTIGLFYAVIQWNSFFPAMIYLKDRARFPMQIMLRNVVIQSDTDTMITDVLSEREAASESVKYATIMVATIPIMLVYPFIQKYFVKGVMIGSVKG